MEQQTGVLRARIFRISAEKMEEMNAWAEEHDKECRFHEAKCYRGLISMSKYTYAFRPSGLGDNPQIVCDCGAKFYSDAGDDDI